MFDDLVSKGFEVRALHHAEAILAHDIPEAVDEIQRCLLEMRIPVEELVAGGGGEAKGTQRLRRSLTDMGWPKHVFEVTKSVDGVATESISHEIDHVKKFSSGNAVALEIEWNNKDPFFDRDLENFKRLHAEGAISIGGLITRGASLHEGMKDIFLEFANTRQISSMEDLLEYGYDPTARQRKNIEQRAERTGDFRQAWADLFVADKFGQATTHWRKLDDRVLRGVGNPCPLILIGIPRSIIEMG